MPADPRPAATVVITRQTPEGLVVFLLRRAGTVGFFPHAWVFPGGRVEAADGQVPVVGEVPQLPADERPFAVAALRECLEECGVWLGQGSPAPDLQARLNARQATLLDAPELVVDVSRLRYWSWWITPEEEPKRYNTRFFLAIVQHEEVSHAAHDEHEMVSSVWIRPADALARAAEGDFFLAPPTFLTLMELAEFEDAEALAQAASRRDIRPILPRLDLSEGVSIVLPGDPSYPAEHPAPVPARRLTSTGGSWRLG